MLVAAEGTHAIKTALMMYDPRHEPRYTIAEAARYVGMLPETLRLWARGSRPMRDTRTPRARRVFSGGEHGTLLNFMQLTEAHILAALRWRHGVPMQKIRKALDWLQKEYKTEHPLLLPGLRTDGLDIVMREIGQVISASEDGQLAIQEIVESHLRRIHWDDEHLPDRFYPFTRNGRCDGPAIIVIDPLVANGRPVIRETRISPSIIRERFHAGEAPDALAEDYDLPPEAVHEAIRAVFDTKAA